MKRVFPFISLLTVMLLSIAACKKGDQGLVGPQGATGAPGAQGVQGPAGSKIYSGQGAPAASVGANGDFYMDLSSGLFYGPKTDAGWGTAISVKGPQGNTGATGATGAAGANGAAGSQILSGSGAPGANLGNNGDYYLDKASYNLYGPKTAGAWGAAILLIGPAGPQGPPGTANVIYSAWFTPNPYIKDTVFGIWGFNYNQAAPGITQNILDQGTVLVYAKMLGYNSTIWPTNQVGQLPIIFQYILGSTTYTDTWSVAASVGNLRIRMINSLNYYGIISNAHQFRYIIIPGGVAGAKAAAHPDYNNYAAVCQYYGIAE